MLEFSFWFRFSRLHYHRHVILHLHTKFHPNRTIRGSYDVTEIFKMVAVSHVEYSEGYCRPPMKCK